VVKLTLKELRALKESPLPEEELARAKDYLKGSLLLALESTMSRMSNLARQEMYFGRYISLDEIAAGVDAVTAEDVLAVARDIFTSDRLALTVLGPENHLKFSRADLDC
jgi:predicted Zn-dependent peptidase